MTYVCFCCVICRRKETCPCVYSQCPRCKKCFKCCYCPEKHARNCGDDTATHDAIDTEIDAPTGPFADLAASKDAS